MHQKYFWLAVLGIIIIALIGFGLRNSPVSQDETNKLQVTTSFYPLYFFAHEIGGDKATVTNITPAGVEPHDYELTTQDMVRLEQSDLIVLNGTHLEAWGDAVVENFKTKNIIVAGESLADNTMEEEGELVADPHVWLSPVRAQKMVDSILSGFIAADADNAAVYTTNAQELKNKLSVLDTQYRRQLQSCVQKSFVTSHAAFGYLAQEFGLTQIAIAGLSPEEEPSVQQLAKVADFAKRNNVKHIFFESLVSPELSETIAHEIGAQTLVLDPLEGIAENDLQAGADYFTVMYNNLSNLTIALQCTDTK